MAINDISLTSGMRNNLLSLQNTTTLINRTQTRLSTGKAVNTALDNPTNFFAAQTATARATDLTNRKDGMSEAVQMVSAANAGITGITSLIQSAQGVAQAALATTSTTDRATYAATFDTLLTQITQLASDSGYRGTNFLNNTNQTVEFAPKTSGATLQINGFDATSSGLGVSNAIGVSSIIPAGTTTTEAVGTGVSLMSAPASKSSITFTYNGPTVNAGGTLTLNLNSAGTDLTPTTFQDTQWYEDVNQGGSLKDSTNPFPNNPSFPSLGNVVLLDANFSDSSAAKTTITGDSQSITVTMQNMPNQVTTGDTLTLDVGPKTVTDWPSSYPGTYPNLLTERTFGTNHKASELSNIKVNGTLQSAGTGYNLVTRSDGNADIVFTDAALSSYPFGINNSTSTGPAGGAVITADVTSSTDRTLPGGNLWATTSGIQNSATQLEGALNTLRSRSSALSANMSVVTARQTFTDNMVTTLQTGADNLTLADTNQEGANLLMLQTRQSLGITSLSLASQAAQSVLKLF